MEENNNQLEQNVETTQPEVTPAEQPVVEPTPVVEPQVDVAQEPVVEQPVAEPTPIVQPQMEVAPQPVEPTVAGPAPIEPQSQTVGVVEQPVAPKKKSALPIIIAIVLVAAVAAVVVLFVLPKQPKEKVIVDKALDGIFSKALSASKEANTIVNQKMNLDLNKEPFHIEGKLNLSANGLPTEYKELEKIKDYDFSYDLTMNVPNEKASGVLTITQSGKKIIDLKSLIEGRYIYIEETNILGSNPIKEDLGTNLFEELKLEEVTEKTDFEVTTRVIEKLSNYIKSSITTDVIKSEQTELNGQKVTKTSIALTQANVAKIYTNFYNSVTNDANFLEDLATLTESDVDTIKSDLKEYLDQINDNPTDESKGEFAVYTNSANKLVKMIFKVEDQTVFDIDNNAGVYTIKSDLIDSSYQITYDENKNTLAVKSAKFNFELTYKDENLTAKLSGSGVELTLEVKSKSSGNDYSSDITLGIKYTENGQTLSGTLKATALVNKSDKLVSINKNNAVSADSLDATTVSTNLQNALKGTIFESFVTQIVSSMNQPSYPYGGYNYNSYGNYNFDSFNWND